LRVSLRSFCCAPDIGAHEFTDRDTDNDELVEVLDNCTLVANPPSGDETEQRDTNSDSFGNICDPDLNNDGLVTVSGYRCCESQLTVMIRMRI